MEYENPIQQQIDDLFIAEERKRITREQYIAQMQELQRQNPAEMGDFLRENGIIKSQGLDKLAGMDKQASDIRDNYTDPSNYWLTAAKEQARYLVEPALVNPTVSAIRGSSGRTIQKDGEFPRVQYAPSLSGADLENTLVHESMHAVDPQFFYGKQEREGSLMSSLEPEAQRSGYNSDPTRSGFTNQGWTEDVKVSPDRYDDGARRREGYFKRQDQDARGLNWWDRLFD